MKDHRYVRTYENGIELLGYVYDKQVNISFEGKIHIAQGVLYNGSRPKVYKNLAGLQLQFLT